MLQQFTLLFLYLSIASAKTITGVFDSFNSLTWSMLLIMLSKGQDTQRNAVWVGP